MSKPFFSGKCLTVLSLMLLFPFLSFAQQLISGKVVGAADHQPLSGVSVSVKGSSSGTSTNNNGVFAINARQGDVLVFTGVSIKTREITVSGNGEIDCRTGNGCNRHERSSGYRTRACGKKPNALPMLSRM